VNKNVYKGIEGACPIEVILVVESATNHSNPIQVSCQNPGVDGSHNVVLLSFLQRFDKVQWFMPVNRSNQPRNVKRWRPRALLPSIFPVSIKYSSFPFLITCPTKRSCLAMIVCINCQVVLARSSTSSFDILSTHEIFIIRHRNHISAACRRASIV